MEVLIVNEKRVASQLFEELNQKESDNFVNVSMGKKSMLHKKLKQFWPTNCSDKFYFHFSVQN